MTWQVDLTGIDRVEVVEGPLSVNYGTNALAGTINLIARKGRTARHVQGLDLC
ncbi:MAG: hypothetical protein H6592_01315 [Flavobacteriales bacterium]|nr:hypothetical protein [Flavobacteriales bacterium]